MIKKIIIYIGICVVIVIAAIGVGSIIGSRIPQSPAGIASNVSTYYCQEGAIVAVYSSSSVALSLSDGRQMTLPQTISASGARYASDTLVFWNEGDNAFITEGDATTYSNCISGIEKSIDVNTTSFTDTSKLFSFSFPNQFSLFGEAGYSQDWAEESTSSGLQLAEIYIPKTFMPQTNFGDAKFTIGVSGDPDAVSQCLVPEFPNMEKVSLATINGIQFTKITFSDAGAGNLYDTTSYRVVRGGECYAIEYTIHSGNIENYPVGAVTAFDESKVQTILESMAQSFKFL